MKRRTPRSSPGRNSSRETAALQHRTARNVPLPPLVERELIEKMSLHVPGKRSGSVQLTNHEIERALATGEHRQTLETYFGAQEYDDLVRLAHETRKKRTTRGAPRVLILPGILGSMLARTRGSALDTIWIDFFDIIRGRMRELKLPDTGKSFKATEAHPGTYLKLKLWLQSQGFNADFHPFDWRLSIPDLGRELAARIAADPATEVYLVAHSMGGLVARAALHADAGQLPKLKRLVMLGTPNFGSFAPVLVYRGLYPFLKKLALLDLAHSAEELGGKIMNNLPGLMEMMPQRSKFSSFDLYDLAQWPASGGRPDANVLANVPAAQQKFAVDPARFVMIAGVNQETTTSVRSIAGELVFERSNAGDGTVPLDFAVLPDILTYYYAEGHGELPKNPTLHRAVVDILRNGSTASLPTEWQRSRAEWKRTVAESDLRLELDAQVQRSRAAMTAEDLRTLFEEFAAPSTRDAAIATPSPVAPEIALVGGPVRNAVVIGRRLQRRVEVRLVRGSITQVRSRAYVLGAFQGIEPSGAALAVDQLMNGTLSEFRQRRMFSHAVGELIILPSARHDVRAENVVFAGLGPIDRFGAQVIQTAAENVARSMVRANIEEFATVLIGAGTGLDIPTALEALLCGFFAGLNDADEHQLFRAITFCEMDAARYESLRSTLIRLSTSAVCDGTEFTLIDLPPPEPVPVSSIRGRIPEQLPPSVYLHVRGVRSGPSSPLTLEAALLTSGPKATVLSGQIVVPEPRLRSQLDLIETNRFRHSFLPQFGRDLAALVLPDTIAAALKKHLDHHLVVVHDAEASRIPWETLCLDGEFPALKGGISRRYVAEQLAVAKWLEQRREDETLDVLLVVNPTEDLAGAEVEGQRILALFNKTPRARAVTIRGPEATKARLRSEFNSGKYDLLHYAGHAFFDASRPARSGILCSGDEVLSGAELAELGNLPSLVFFNACEAGRIRKANGAQGSRGTKNIRQRIERSVGLAEAFLRGGVANYVGTYWPVGDSSAETFADRFYGAILQEKTIGEALAVGRKALDRAQTQDWADYIFYGSYDFRVKKPT